jgi:aminoglycoside 6'-N-acetyltransferase I
MREGQQGLWGAMRSRLWTDCGAEENDREYAAFAAGSSALQVVFLAFVGNGAVGFAEISERSVVAGCDAGPAAYLEGWYVEPPFQRQGVGAALVAAALDWARRRGYGCFGSDVELHNLASQRAHEALGFAATGTVVTYCMDLGS